MAFSQIELKRIKQTVGELCRKRSPPHLGDQLRLEYAVKGHDVVLYECRPRWKSPPDWGKSPIAKFKFVRTGNYWRLYWQRRDLKWHAYEGCPASGDLNELVQEVDADPLACFFG